MTSELQARIKNLLEINDSHRRLNGELRKELQTAESSMTIRSKIPWFVLGFFIACLMVIPYHIKVMDDFNNKYEERCMIAEVIIAEPFGGGNMRVEGEQMMCGSNWRHSFIYFPGFEPYLERMWQDELINNPLVEKGRE